jgi:hypothetical protein
MGSSNLPTVLISLIAIVANVLVPLAWSILEFDRNTPGMAHNVRRSFNLYFVRPDGIEVIQLHVVDACGTHKSRQATPKALLGSRNRRSLLPTEHLFVSTARLAVPLELVRHDMHLSMVLSASWVSVFLAIPSVIFVSHEKE